jgi:predicted transcriptional regulator
MVSLDDMLFEISSEVRHKILEILRTGSTTVTNVSNDLQISMTEASRHFNRLSQVGLIQKNPSGDYSITILGKTVLTQLGPLEFITRHSEYFDSHDATAIPEQFLNRIHELREAVPTYTSRANIMKTVQKMEATVFHAEEFYDCILDQGSMELIIYAEPDPESADRVTELVQKGVRSRALMPNTVDVNRIHPDSMNSFMELHRYDNFEFRVFDEIPLLLQMNEKGVALLAFLNMENVIDFMGFSATDSRSIQWCKDVFEYYWKKATPFFQAISK